MGSVVSAVKRPECKLLTFTTLGLGDIFSSFFGSGRSDSSGKAGGVMSKPGLISTEQAVFGN